MTDTADLAARVERVADILEAEQGRPDIVRRGSLLDSVVRVILSQSTSDVNSGRAWKSLEERFSTWDEALEAGPEEIEKTIRAGGLAKQKSRYIHGLLTRVKGERGALALDYLCDWSDDEVFEWLGEIDGVGTKSIAVVLMFACGRDVCPVDTHVLRISRRLGFVPSNATAEKAFWALKDLIPEGRAPSLHINLIRFGKSRCTARNPDCDGCPFADECLYDRESGEIRAETERS